MSKEKTIEIVEYWNKEIPLYEVMTREEFDKKLNDLPYQTLQSEKVAPFVVWDYSKNPWVAFSKHYNWTEFKNKLPDLPTPNRDT